MGGMEDHEPWYTQSALRPREEKMSNDSDYVTTVASGAGYTLHSNGSAEFKKDPIAEKLHQKWEEDKFKIDFIKLQDSTVTMWDGETSVWMGIREFDSATKAARHFKIQADGFIYEIQLEDGTVTVLSVWKQVKQDG